MNDEADDGDELQDDMERADVANGEGGADDPDRGEPAEGQRDAGEPTNDTEARYGADETPA